MGLQKDDILSDPLVVETLRIIREDGVPAVYKRMDGFKLPEFDPEDCGHPALAVLLETDSLDSTSAAVLVAESLGGMVDFSAVESKLDREVSGALKLMRADEMIFDADAIVRAKNPTALKLAVATVAGMLTGPEFLEMKAQADPMEIKVAMVQIGGLVTDMAERLCEDKAWAVLPPRLLDRYLDGMTELAGMSGSRVQKRVINEIIQELKTQVAKGTAEEIVETTPPQIDPNSKFEQLKDRAKKFKPD
jgi:hypothetical protein